MLKVYSSPVGTSVHNIKNVLEASGIECTVRGENLTVGVGELPPVECWAELWIVDESRLKEAKSIISGADQPAGDPWTCAGCNERIEAEFGQCWNCQTHRPS